MKCEGCSLESDRADLFRTANHFFKPQATLCPACFQQTEHKINTFLVWSFFIIGIASFPLLFWPPTHVLGFVLLCCSIIQVWVLLSTILHELGHIAAGHVAGLRVFGIEIGHGQIVYEFFFRRLRWRLRALPFGGCAHGASCTAKFYRLRNSLFVLGGPLTNILLLLIAIILLPLDKLLESTIFNGVAPFLFLALSNAIILLYSLLPRMGNSARGRVPNDALLFWRILRMKQTQIDETLPWRYIFEADECRYRKDLQAAQTWIREGLQKFPKSVALKIADSAILYLQKRYSEAARSYALLAGRHEGAKKLGAYILNNLAYCYLLIGEPKLLMKADTCSRLALKQAPSVPAFKGTRGSVLVELGNYEEGLKLLHETMKSHPETKGQALNACYIGIAEARLGNPRESQNYFAVARKLDPDCILLNREQIG